jgi:hypothetical protein
MEQRLAAPTSLGSGGWEQQAVNMNMSNQSNNQSIDQWAALACVSQA